MIRLQIGLRVLDRANAHLRDGNSAKYIEWMRVLSALNEVRGAETMA